MLIINIKKINHKTKILVLGNNNNDKVRIMEYGAEEYSLLPLSPENVADKIFYAYK